MNKASCPVAVTAKVMVVLWLGVWSLQGTRRREWWVGYLPSAATNALSELVRDCFSWSRLLFSDVTSVLGRDFCFYQSEGAMYKPGRPFVEHHDC